VTKIDEKMKRIAQNVEDARLNSEQKTIFAQKRMNLAAVKKRINKTQNSHQKDSIATFNDHHSHFEKLLVKIFSQTFSTLTKFTQTQQLKFREHIKTAMKHNEFFFQKE
jgi:predicted RNase H-like nuclease (RuvC/YqgF family)